MGMKSNGCLCDEIDPKVCDGWAVVDDRTCIRCGYKAYQHIETAGIGQVCPVQVTVFTPRDA